MTGRRRPARSAAHPVAAFLAATGLLGAILLIAGLVQTNSGNVLAGIPAAVPETHAAMFATTNGHGFGAGTVSAPTTTAPAPSTTSPPAKRSASAPATPAPQPMNTIRLPRGDTAALIEQQQLAPDGSLPVPPGVRDAIWWGVSFNAGSGATLFVGHVNWAGSTGPFAELWQDTVGGMVSVVDGQGKVWRYRVTQVLTVPKDQLAAQAPALFGQSGPRRIVLATCGGEWVGGQLGYNENRMLVATPV